MEKQLKNRRQRLAKDGRKHFWLFLKLTPLLFIVEQIRFILKPVVVRHWNQFWRKTVKIGVSWFDLCTCSKQAKYGMVNHLTAGAAGRQQLQVLLASCGESDRGDLGWLLLSSCTEGARGVFASIAACSQAAWVFSSRPLPYSLDQKYFHEKCCLQTWKQGWNNLFGKGKMFSIMHPMLRNVSIIPQACTAASPVCTCIKIRPPPPWKHFKTGVWWAKYQCRSSGLSVGGICSDLKGLNSSLVTPANCLYGSLSPCQAPELPQLICIDTGNSRRVHEQVSGDTESRSMPEETFNTTWRFCPLVPLSLTLVWVRHSASEIGEWVVEVKSHELKTGTSSRSVESCCLFARTYRCTPFFKSDYGL